MTIVREEENGGNGDHAGGVWGGGRCPSSRDTRAGALARFGGIDEWHQLRHKSFPPRNLDPQQADFAQAILIVFHIIKRTPSGKHRASDGDPKNQAREAGNGLSTTSIPIMI